MSIKLGNINIAGGIPETSVINGVVIDILSALYPIGALYITSNSATTCPMETLGVGSWELVAQDRVLQGAGERGTVGDTLPESLPNISGNLGAGTWSSFRATATTSPFTVVRESGDNGYPNTGTNNTSYGKHCTFNTSLSSSIYQDDAHVQPSAYLVNIWKRTA